MTSFEEYCERGRHRHGDRFSPPTATHLIAAYNHGHRVEVDIWGDGSTILRGRVSLTTGWVPSFLLIRRRSDVSSSWLLDDRSKILRVVAL